MTTGESKYVEKKGSPSRQAHEQRVALHESAARRASEFGDEAEWFRCVKEDFPKYLPFLTQNCGLEFRGRVLEIGGYPFFFSMCLRRLGLDITTVDLAPQRAEDLIAGMRCK